MKQVRPHVSKVAPSSAAGRTGGAPKVASVSKAEADSGVGSAAEAGPTELTKAASWRASVSILAAMD